VGDGVMRVVVVTPRGEVLCSTGLYRAEGNLGDGTYHESMLKSAIDSADELLAALAEDHK
jgi:hypothetical protein